ncbi:TetR/AcrR family transcriptional regulator [Gephyromycinifex aptenodytis]|uniref:TetR/AcrR family transcriptional regulator n=1 Tax=Gephyromycinifex aptenodytis TaxID=2716227 RepID=UPI0014480ACD|nr:TetR/AcrR family transcriptional regulator [Gephyromycinifex aptenodytis]
MPTEADPSSRRRLLLAAVEAFGTRGYKGTTTRDIALAAGMSPAAIYVHHRSKEELLFVVCEAGHLELLAEVEQAISKATDPRERLTGVMRAFVVEHAINQATARVVNDEVGSLGPEHREHIIGLRRQLDEHVRRIVEDGVAAGMFDAPDPSMTTRALLSLGMDVARWFLPGGRWSVEQIADRYCEFALRMVGAEPPRSA